MTSNKQNDTPALFTELENLKGNSPKLMGYDYFHVIYTTAVALILAMIWVYLIVEDQTVKNMVLGQGLLSCGLILSVIFFRSKLDSPSSTSSEVSQKKSD